MTLNDVILNGGTLSLQVFHENTARYLKILKILKNNEMKILKKSTIYKNPSQ